MKRVRSVTDKTEEADAVDARSAAAEETDDEQQRSDTDKKRRGPVQRLTRGPVQRLTAGPVQRLTAGRRLGAIRRTGGGRQQRAVPQSVSLSMLPHADTDQ